MLFNVEVYTNGSLSWCCHLSDSGENIKLNGQRVKHISHVFISLSLIERTVVGSKAIE